MKKHLYRYLFVLASFSLLFTACKKEAVTDNFQDEELTLKAKAETEINESKAVIENFNRDFAPTTSITNSPNRGQGTIVDVASKIPIFKALVAAVVKTGLAPTLSSTSVNLTVFAPTDFAFAKLPSPFNNASNISGISNPEQIDALKNILLFHVLGAEVKRNQIAAGRSSALTLKPVSVLNDNRIYLSNQFGLITINGNSLALITDVDASNGVIHAIDDVLIPPTQTIAQIAIGNPNLSALVAALVKTNLASVFAGEGNFTVLAPTNNAFSRLPPPFNNAAAISAISNPEQINVLANILKYHVIGSRYFSLDFGILSPIETIAAAPNNRVVAILGLNSAAVKGNKNRFFSSAHPVNILATNGTVHVIDQVLLP